MKKSTKILLGGVLLVGVGAVLAGTAAEKTFETGDLMIGNYTGRFVVKPMMGDPGQWSIVIYGPPGEGLSRVAYDGFYSFNDARDELDRMAEQEGWKFA